MAAQDVEHFEATYRAQAPDGSPVVGAGWEIGRAQPVMIELAESGEIRGQVLDAGCGTGDIAIELARRGHPVTGVDGAPSAIVHARHKAAQAGIQVEFAVADALDLTGYEDRFDTVVDSGLLHTFSAGDRLRYVAELHRVCRPGARVHVLAFSDREPGDWGPHRIRESELRAAFGDGWELETLRPAPLLAHFRDAGDYEVKAWLATARRA